MKKEEERHGHTPSTRTFRFGSVYNCHIKRTIRFGIVRLGIIKRNLNSSMLTEFYYIPNCTVIISIPNYPNRHNIKLLNL